MPRIKFLTFDFGSTKKTDPLLTEDRKTQVIQNIEQRNHQQTPPKTSLRFMVLVLLAISGIAVFSSLRYGVLQKENFSLNDQVRKLNRSIQTLENENKDLALRTERAEKERQNLKDAIDNYKKENESFKFEAKKNEARANSAAEEKTYLEEILINKTKEIENLKAGGIPVATGVPNDLDQRLNQKEDEIRQLTEQNRLLNDKLQKLYQTTDIKMKEISVAKIALEDTISDARKVIDNEFGSIDLGSIAVNSQAAPSSPAAASDKRSDTRGRTSAKKQGHVLAINEDHGFIVVDMGKVDGIKSGTNLYLKKNGETVATLTVLEVRDVMTACNVRNLAAGKKIEINDLVSVQN